MNARPINDEGAVLLTHEELVSFLVSIGKVEKTVRDILFLGMSQVRDVGAEVPSDYALAAFGRLWTKVLAIPFGDDEHWFVYGIPFDMEVSW